MSISKNAYYQDINRVSGQLSLLHLMQLAQHDAASYQARAIANLKIQQLESWIKQHNTPDLEQEQRAHYQFALRQIALYNKDPGALKLAPALKMPDGSPIGSEFGCTF